MGGSAYDFRQGTDRGRDDGCAGGHGFEGRQAETFIERREDEGCCEFVENAQGAEWDVAEEADAVFHAAVHYGSAHGGVKRDIVADDDEAEVFEFFGLFEGGAGDGEGFD